MRIVSGNKNNLLLIKQKALLIQDGGALPKETKAGILAHCEQVYASPEQKPACRASAFKTIATEHTPSGTVV
ncbi:MAG: hypothetical protein LBO67_01350 [Spirochaetaceae bacterium]|nr:hypothetical protein [Spirochaetaceae bacterium]